MKNNKVIAFIGAGNMARAMITGLLENGFHSNHIWASSPGIKQRDHFKNILPIQITTSNVEAASHADVIVLAVKPWMIETVANEIKSIVQQKKALLISVVTGIKTHTFSEFMGNHMIPIVRTMPNIASSVGAGMTALFATTSVSEEQKMFAESLFRSMGSAMWVADENQLDVITAVSGSGPAYLFYVFEAMQSAAESMGLSAEQSKLLITQTAVGAAKMAIETDHSFESLRKMVTAEKGTTAAATAILDERNTKKIVHDAMMAAWHRAKELSK